MDIFHIRDTKEYNIPKYIGYNNEYIYIIPELYEIKEKVNTITGRLDQLDPEEQKKYGKVTDRVELVNWKFKETIGKLTGLPHRPARTFTKLYEVLLNFPIVPKKAAHLKYLDICAAPGTFLVTMNHFVKTQSNIGNYEWFAESLNPAVYGKAFGDHYGLMKRHPSHWFWGKEGTGDITNSMEISSFKTDKIQNFDVITSDCGLPYNVNNPEDFFEHEAKVQNVFFGAVTTVLYLLRKGGNAVFKAFTVFEISQLTTIYLLCTCFENVYITKPMTSTPGSAEIYIVCLNYKKPFKEYDTLFFILDNFDPYKGIVSKNVLPKSFIDQMVDIMDQTSTRQIEAVNRNWWFYQNPDKVYKARYDQENFLEKFLKQYNIEKINPTDNI